MRSTGATTSPLFSSWRTGDSSKPLARSYSARARRAPPTDRTGSPRLSLAFPAAVTRSRWPACGAPPPLARSGHPIGRRPGPRDVRVAFDTRARHLPAWRAVSRRPPIECGPERWTEQLLRHPLRLGERWHLTGRAGRKLCRRAWPPRPDHRRRDLDHHRRRSCDLDLPRRGARPLPTARHNSPCVGRRPCRPCAGRGRITVPPRTAMQFHSYPLVADATSPRANRAIPSSGS